MWWWGPCASASCCADVVVPQRKRAAALYDELVPLLTDRRATATTSDDDGDDADDDDKKNNSDSALRDFQRRGSSGLGTIAPGIYRARDVHTHDAVALKVFDKRILKSQTTRRRIRQELHVLSRCRDHPSILRLYGVYSSSSTFEIAFELARGGEVMHRIQNAGAAAQADAVAVGLPPYRVTEREISRVVASAASAVRYMHQQGIVHGEIRPEHLLYSDLEPDARVLLVDFGRAAAWRELTFRSRVHRGKFLWHDRHSSKFLPPWVVQQRSPRSTEDLAPPDWVRARQLDIWSVGVTMYVLLCGTFPFNGSTLEEIRNQIVHKHLLYPPPRRRSRRERGAKHPDEHATTLSRAAKDLLAKLLEKDPALAPSIEDVCAHPWLSSDVAADVRWSEAQIDDFGQFAQTYARDVAASSLRQPTPGEGQETSSSSSSRHLMATSPSAHGQRQEHESPLLQYDVYGIESDGAFYNGPSSGNNTMDDEFDADERPSFVSTDGNVQATEPEERLSADAYMRLANAELEAFTARRAAVSPSPRHRTVSASASANTSANANAKRKLPTRQQRNGDPAQSLNHDHEQREDSSSPAIRGEFRSVLSKNRRLFSFKSLSLRSASSE